MVYYCGCGVSMLPETMLVFWQSVIVCLFIISWLYPILWVLIKLESRGPAIFKQEREGFNGEEFVCYKFRSMKINAMSDKIHAVENDIRVTKIGSFIRKTSIDELPQFWNVLKGEMSLVGPRPERQFYIDKIIERFKIIVNT